MGAIFSRPVNYVKQKINQKVEDTKAAIRTRIDNTKNAIYTKIDNTKQGIKDRIDNTTNAITTKVTDTTTAVCTRVTNVKDGVVNRYIRVRDGVIAVKDGVVTRVNNTCTAVKTRYTRTKEAVIYGYTTVKTKCINTKNVIQDRYTRVRNKVVDTYRRVRNAKLTRAQKIKYGLLASFIMIWLLIGFVILLDLYLGDYKAAEWKVEAVKAFWCCVGAFTWEVTVNCMHYARVGGEYAWEGTKIGSAYVWEGTKIVGDHIWHAILIVYEHLLYGAMICGQYMWHGTKIAAQETYNGMAVTADYIARGAATSAQYTKEGAVVAFDYGSYAAKESAIYLYEGTKYALINLAIGSYHGAIHLFHVTRMCVWGFLTGSYSGSAILMDGTTFIANKTYHGTFALVNYTCLGVNRAWEFGCITVAFVSHWSVVGSTHAWDAATKSIFYIYNGIISGSLFLWESLCALCSFIYNWTLIISERTVTTTVNVCTFIWTWGQYILINGSKGLYYGLNQFGLRWLYNLSQLLAKWGGTLGAIFTKFFTDLGLYLWNFIYVTSMHIYNVLYIILSFIYTILSALMGIVRIKMDGLKYCVQLVFRAIIWVLEETLIGYYYMLDKYNNYREWLFVGFLGLITIYCTGLIRDRRQSAESDSEDESDEGEDDLGGRVQDLQRKGSDLPPIYEHPELPDYQDSSEDEFHFDADQDMNLEGLAESEEEDLDLKSEELKGKDETGRKSAGHDDSDPLSDDSLETPSSHGESDREKLSSSSMSEKTLIQDRKEGSSPKSKMDLETEADDECDNDLDPESLSEGEGDLPHTQNLPREPLMHDRVAALIQTPASDVDSTASTPSDFFAGHDLGTPGSLDTPSSDVSMSIGTPPSDFFAGHDLASLDSIETPDSEMGGIGTSEDIFDEPPLARVGVDTPSSDFDQSVGTPASDFFAGHSLETPASDLNSVGTPASDFFAGHHLHTPGSSYEGTSASNVGTPASDFFAGHHLATPGSIDTPGSDFGAGSSNSDLDRRGNMIFEHGLEGQSDLDSLEAVPVSSSDAESPDKPARKDTLKKKLQHFVSDSDEDADCESDPETECTLKERVDAIKGRRKSYKQQLMEHVDSDNVESPMSPMSPISTGSVDDDRSCDTDSLQNLLVSESGDEADDSLRISSAMSDDMCEDSLGEDHSDDGTSTDNIPAGMGSKDQVSAKLSVTSMPIDIKPPFDNQANIHPRYSFGSKIKHEAKELQQTGSHLETIFGDSSKETVDNETRSMSASRDALSQSSSMNQMTASDIDNGHGFPSAQ